MCPKFTALVLTFPGNTAQPLRTTFSTIFQCTQNNNNNISINSKRLAAHVRVGVLLESSVGQFRFVENKTSSDMEDAIVDKVFGFRIIQDDKQYLVKWKSREFKNQNDMDVIRNAEEEEFSDDELEWVSACKFDFKKEIEEFMTREKAKREITEVCGVTKHNGLWTFIVKWKDNKAPFYGYLSIKEMTNLYPRILIHYYESNIVFPDEIEDESQKNLPEGKDEMVQEPSKKKAKRENKQVTLKNGCEEKIEDTEVDELYEVESIFDKRVHNGHIEYFLKWQNYSEKYNSWEPKDHLNCPEMVWNFEKYCVKGYQKHWELEKILECLPTDFGEMYFKVKWKESRTPEVVPSKILKAFWWPELAAFYARKIKWVNDHPVQYYG